MLGESGQLADPIWTVGRSRAAQRVSAHNGGFRDGVIARRQRRTRARARNANRLALTEIQIVGVGVGGALNANRLNGRQHAIRRHEAFLPNMRWGFPKLCEDATFPRAESCGASLWG
jgi:hypothetical protein